MVWNGSGARLGLWDVSLWNPHLGKPGLVGCQISVWIFEGCHKLIFGKLAPFVSNGNLNFHFSGNRYKHQLPFGVEIVVLPNVSKYDKHVLNYWAPTTTIGFHWVWSLRCWYHFCKVHPKVHWRNKEGIERWCIAELAKSSFVTSCFYVSPHVLDLFLFVTSYLFDQLMFWYSGDVVMCWYKSLYRKTCCYTIDKLWTAIAHFVWTWSISKLFHQSLVLINKHSYPLLLWWVCWTTLCI